MKIYTRLLLLIVVVFTITPILTPISSVKASVFTPITEDTQLKSVQSIPIISKKYPSPKGYEPKDLVGFKNSELGINKGSVVGDRYTSSQQGVKVAVDNLKKLITDLNSRSGHKEVYVTSAYRTFSYQEDVYNGHKDRIGETEADKISARAGYSEHQTGLAFDVTTLEHSGLTQAFGDTNEGKWLAENAHKYGFIIRYEKGQESITGYVYEPWHIRYIGIDKANEYKEGNYKTLEEFLDIDGDSNTESNNSEDNDTSNSDGEGSGEKTQPFDPFEQGFNQTMKTGVDDGTIAIPPTIAYAFQTYTNKTYAIMMVISQVVLAFMIVLISLQTAVLAYRVKVGEANHARVQKTIDLFTGKIPEEKLTRYIILNFFYIVLIFSILYSKFHIFVFHQFYLLLDNILAVL